MDRYLTPGQVAEALAVSVKTIHNLVSARKIESVKVGRAVRISKQSIDQYLEKNTRRAR